MALNVKDANNQLQVLKTDIDGSGQHIPHHIVDGSALPAGAAADSSLQAILTAVLTGAPGNTTGNPLYAILNSSPGSGLAKDATLAALVALVTDQASASVPQPITASS